MSNHPWLPYGIYAKVTGAATLALTVIGLIALVANIGGRIPAFICLPIALTLGIVGLVFWFLSRSHRKKAVELLDGEVLVHWTYMDEDWQAWLDTRKRKGVLFSLLFTGILFAVGLIVGLLLMSDGDAIGDSGFLTWFVPAAGGTAVGVVVSIFTMGTGAYVTALLRKIDGICVISDTGIYLPGVFWPFRAFGSTLSEVSRKRNLLVFEFEVTSGQYDSTTTVKVPIPAGGEVEAEQVVATLKA